MLPSFLYTWDGGGFCGHESGPLSRHATWPDACCPGKLVSVLGAHWTLKLDQSSCWGRNYCSSCWVAWECFLDRPVDKPVCLSSISPAADGDASLELGGSGMGLSPGASDVALVARAWHMVISAAPVGSWASGGIGKDWPFPGVQPGPTGQGLHVIPQQVSGLGISDMGTRCWDHHYCSSQTSWGCWSHFLIDRF